MPATLVTLGLDRLIRKAEALRSLDVNELLVEWTRILDRDNKRGALAGLDGWDRPLRPVVYRPTRSKFTVSSAYRQLPNDNLSSAWYQTLDGPPLAPSREQSRVYKSFETAVEFVGPGLFRVQGAWKNVLAPNGVPLLPFHFRGEGRLPVRNLAHVRPTAEREARAALREFVVRKLKDS